MGKSDDRARLEALLAQFKGEIKRVPSSRSVVAAPRAKKKPARKRPDAGERKTQGVGEASPTEGNDKPPDADAENIEIDSGGAHSPTSDKPADRCP
jgi:hypothetical protein